MKKIKYKTLNDKILLFNVNKDICYIELASKEDKTIYSVRYSGIINNDVPPSRWKCTIIQLCIFHNEKTCAISIKNNGKIPGLFINKNKASIIIDKNIIEIYNMLLNISPNGYKLKFL